MLTRIRASFSVGAGSGAPGIDDAVGRSRASAPNSNFFGGYCAVLEICHENGDRFHATCELKSGGSAKFELVMTTEQRDDMYAFMKRSPLIFDNRFESASLWERGLDDTPEWGRDNSPLPNHTLSLALIRRSDRAVWLVYLGLIPVQWNLWHSWIMYELPEDQAVFWVGPLGTRFGINHLLADMYWLPVDYDSDDGDVPDEGMPDSVRLGGLREISSNVLLWHSHHKSTYRPRYGNLDMTEPDSKGRWWTPRGQNPWAWAFGTP